MGEMGASPGLRRVVARLEGGVPGEGDILEDLATLVDRIRSEDIRLLGWVLWDVGLIRRSDHVEVIVYFARPDGLVMSRRCRSESSTSPPGSGVVSGIGA